MDYAGREGPVEYAGEGPGGFGQGGDQTVIEGGDSRFVVEYTYDQAADAASRSADLAVKGGNNEFVLHVDGSAGGSDISIEGGNNKFVVIFDNATGGGNTVHVDGGNNQFVVRFDYSGEHAGGDVVTVDGANNQYVVATSVGGESDVAVAGPGGGFGTLPGGQPAAENGGQYDFSAFGNSADSPLLAMFGGAAAGGQGGEAGPVYDFSAFGDPDASGTDGAGSMGGSPFGGGANPFGGAPSGSDETSGGPAGGQGSDLASLLAQSPFGRLLDLPGIDGPEDIFGNVAGDFPGGNPFAGTGATPGSNPFAGFGGGANPFAGGSSGDQTAPPGAGDGDAAGGEANPFAGFAAGGQTGNPDYDFGALQSSGDADAAFAASPFGPLIGLPGIDGPEDIFGDGFAAAFGGSQGGDAASDDTGGDVGEVEVEAEAASVPAAEFSPIG
ncbi:hypothetical protein E2C06_34975 [Dankookia rubra]|uniref:Uncharacterized protein n=1 Tax=Dankookia rubra TaxID=1442381 RepID=A0A4R5Q6C3_9PROT|nr:hypothetical protein [Dankookia rubra]TDH57988.1 hypothetical protein E2C06_34975 [Dankookia rubra]